MSVTVHVGDCREVLATLPAAAVQCVVTSPPYFNLRNYNNPGQIGLEATPEAYIAELVKVFREVRRVMRDDAILWLNLGDCFLNKQLQQIPARVALALQADGWFLRSEIVWSKAAPMPESVRDRPTCAHEKVWLLSKRAEYFYDADAVAEPAISAAPAGNGFAGRQGGSDRVGPQSGGAGTEERWQPGGARNLRNVWHLNPELSGIAHYAMMPTALALRCIKAGTSEKGCCPGCGAPWMRVTQRERLRDGKPLHGAWDIDAGGRRLGATGVGHWRDTVAVKTTGWAPSCACSAHGHVPCTVLDPFAGGGTTLLCADRLGRHAVGVEINETYAGLARDRVRSDAPLLSEVA